MVKKKKEKRRRPECVRERKQGEGVGGVGQVAGDQVIGQLTPDHNRAAVLNELIRPKPSHSGYVLCLNSGSASFEGLGLCGLRRRVLQRDLVNLVSRLEHFLVASPDILPLRHDFCRPGL